MSIYKSILLKNEVWCQNNDCIKKIRANTIAIQNSETEKIICQSCFAKIAKPLKEVINEK